MTWNDPYNDPPDSTYEEEEEKKKVEEDDRRDDIEPGEKIPESSGYRATEDYGEGSAPKYDITDSRWEAQFDSSQMIQITRKRLFLLKHGMSLGKIPAGLGARGAAFVIDLAVTLALIVGPFYLDSIGYLDRIFPQDINTRTLILLANAFFALFYYRFPFALYGGRTIGRVLAGTRLVDHEGRYLTFIQAIVHIILQTVTFIPPLFLINGLISLLRKDHSSLIDIILNTREVMDTHWVKIAKKCIYGDDISRLSR